MADRYCRNCGHELAENDRFCPSCGTPIQEAAHVPTPEADVPVPPPPQAGSAGTAAPGQPAQAGFGRRHPILTGCLGIIALLALLGIVGAAIGGGGGGQQAAESPPERAEQDEGDASKPEPKKEPKEEKPQAEKKPPPPEYSVGQTAQVGNVEWKVARRRPTLCGDRPRSRSSCARTSVPVGPLPLACAKDIPTSGPAPIPLLSHSARRALAGREPRTSQPISHGRQEVSERSL